MGKKGKGKKGKIFIGNQASVSVHGGISIKDTAKPKEEFPKLSKGAVDKKFEQISKQCELAVPIFYPIDNVVINKYVYKKVDESILQNYSKYIDQQNVEKELIDIEDFNFYVDHVNSVLEHVLFSNFYEFHK